VTLTSGRPSCPPKTVEGRWRVTCSSESIICIPGDNRTGASFRLAHLTGTMRLGVGTAGLGWLRRSLLHRGYGFWLVGFGCFPGTAPASVFCSMDPPKTVVESIPTKNSCPAFA
jgi:hypothetical protein